MGKKRKRGPFPSLCLHRASGLAYATDPRTGKEVYFGPAGSPEAAAAYENWCLELAAWRRANPGAGYPPPKPRKGPLSVAALCSRFLDHAEVYYVKGGKQTSEVAAFRSVIRRLNDRSGAAPAAGYGPLELKRLQKAMVAEGLARGVVNQYVGRVRGVFRWGVGEELVPPSVLAALEAVVDVRKGRGGVYEPPPVRPADPAAVEALLPYLEPHLADLVRFQLAAGCRPGEAVVLRACDVDTTRTPWEYRPCVYKTEHHEGRAGERVVYLGPKARSVVADRLARCKPAGWVWPGARRGTHYRVSSYAHTLAASIVRANGDRAARGLPPLPHFAPNQLRHTQATLVRAGVDLDAAQQMLGHASPQMSLRYAENDARKARDAAERFG
jgi:integrase